MIATCHYFNSVFIRSYATLLLSVSQLCRLSLVSTLFFLSMNASAQVNIDTQAKLFLDRSLEQLEAEDYDKAIEFAQQAYESAQNSGNDIEMASALEMEANALLKKPKKVKLNRKKATEKLEISLYLLGTSEDRSLQLKVLNTLLDLSEQRNDIAQIGLYKRKINQLLHAQTTDLKQAEETENLSNTVEKLNNQRAALRLKVQTLNEEQLKSELVIALQKNSVDSLQFESELDSLALEQHELLVLEQAAKLKLQKSQQNFFIALMSILAIVVVGLFLRYRDSKRHTEMLEFKNRIIEEEKEKSDKLLLNILPSVVANELKLNGTAKARKYQTATVLFSDFVNFSSISKSLTPEQLVSLLDFYFKLFDDVIEKHGLEKIKTIGDAYMCVGGLPEKTNSHAQDVISAALEIQTILDQQKLEHEKKGQPYFEARIGIHTGPLVAGVVGSKKFAFDIWGDTVNIASRLESGGEPGKVNISGVTHELIQNQFSCTSRGKIPIKNRGEIEMFFVEHSELV